MKRSSLFTSAARALLPSCSLLVLSSFTVASDPVSTCGCVMTPQDGSLGGRVWFDGDKNGLQSDDVRREGGFRKAPVTLLNSLGENIATTYTDDTGRYKFDGLPEGKYQVYFVNPPKFGMTAANVDYNAYDERDSDANPETGITDWVTLSPERPYDFSVDVGHIPLAGSSNSAPPQQTQGVDDAVTVVVGDTVIVDVLRNDRLGGKPNLSILDSDVPGNVDVKNYRVVISNTDAVGTFYIKYRIACADGSGSEAVLTVTIKPPVAVPVIVTPTPTPVYTPEPVYIPEPVYTPEPVLIEKDPTIALDDAVTGRVGDLLRVSILDNDTPSETIKTVKIIESNVPGDVAIDAYGDLVIDQVQTAGAFWVRYKLVSSSGSFDIAEVEVDIRPAPTEASDDSVQGLVGEPLNVRILDNDAPSAGVDYVRITGTDVPGRVMLNQYGELIIKDTEVAGVFEVEYELISTSGSRDKARVQVLLEAPEIPTQANDDDVSGYVGEELTVNVFANDLPSDGVADAFVLDGNVPGDVSFNSEGQVEIKNTTASGDYWFSYALISNSGSEDDALVSVYLEEGVVEVPEPEVAPEPESPRDPYRAPSACVVADYTTNNKNGDYTWVVEPTLEDYAPKYRTYGAGGNLIAEIEPYKPSQGYITVGGVMELRNYAVIRKFEGGIPYYVSSVMKGIESPRVRCDFNTHNTPIALDVNGSGAIERVLGEFAFDFNADGKLTTVSQWFGANDGILVDTRIEGDITGQHLFGDMGGRYADGFAKLVEWDLNQDGQIQGGELTHLGLWIDRNSNARLDAGELSTLSEHGVIGLNTQHHAFFSKATLENGQSMLMEDVWFPVLAPSTFLAPAEKAIKAGAVKPVVSQSNTSAFALLSGLGLLLASLGLWRSLNKESDESWQAANK